MGIAEAGGQGVDGVGAQRAQNAGGLGILAGDRDDIRDAAEFARGQANDAPLLLGRPWMLKKS
jgi:hypothetical protein